MSERGDWIEISAAEGDVEMLDAFLEGTTSLQTRNMALVVASRAGHLGVVERLLMAGADVNARVESGTALELASKGGPLEVVKRLRDELYMLAIRGAGSLIGPRLDGPLWSREVSPGQR